MGVNVNKLFSFNEFSAPVYALEPFEQEGFFTGGGDRLVSVWKPEENSKPHVIVNTGSTIYSLNHISKKNLLLIGVSGGGMHVIDLEKKKEIHFLVNHQKGVFDIKYSHKNDIVFTAGGDGVVSLWDGNFSFIRSITLCEEKIRALAFDRNDKHLLTACGDGTIRVFEIDPFREMHRINAHDGSVNSLALHPTKNYLLSGGKDAHLNRWSTENFERLESIPAHNYAIYSISFSPDNNFFATGSRDKTIKIWDSGDFRFLTRIDSEKLEGHHHSVNKVLWMNQALISGSDDRKIMGWKVIADVRS